MAPQITKTLQMGTGLTLNLLRDDSVPPDHLDHWQAEAVSTGEGSPFSVPQHWHKKHAERMTVTEGRVKATLNGVTTILSAGESIYIEPYVVHGFEGFAGERAVVRERADPAGDYKAAFFNDLLAQGWPAPFWYMLRVFYDGDSYPPLGLYFKFFDVAFITVLGGIAKLIAAPREKLE